MYCQCHLWLDILFELECSCILLNTIKLMCVSSCLNEVCMCVCDEGRLVDIRRQPTLGYAKLSDRYLVTATPIFHAKIRSKFCNKYSEYDTWIWAHIRVYIFVVVGLVVCFRGFWIGIENGIYPVQFILISLKHNLTRMVSTW